MYRGQTVLVRGFEELSVSPEVEVGLQGLLIITCLAMLTVLGLS